MLYRETKTLTLDAARSVAAAAEVEAQRQGWPVAIAIVDSAGELVCFHRLDGTQPASLGIAVGKARTAARFKRPTKALEDAVAGGRTALLAVDGLVPMEGGLPIAIDGEIVGAVGVSGVLSPQDARVAQAGVDALTDAIRAARISGTPSLSIHTAAAAS